MGSRLTDILARPRPLPLGGRSWLVGELTLGDLATLQADLDARTPDPLGDVRGRLAGMEAEERRVALVAAYAAAEQGPPAWTGPQDDIGGLEFLRVALSRHNPGLTAADVERAFAEATSEEFLAILRACQGVTPLDECEAWLGLDRSGAGTPIPWAQALCEVLEAYPGYTLDSLGDLTLTQVRALRAGGRPEVRAVPVKVGPGRDLKTLVREARAKFHGPGGGETKKGAG